ncbi:FAD dependent oxidoreductase [Aspergillus bombycis]|uniref:FAD dependent oxidoreductase n=1 Tax=Aspergillus bombycis TaxID=109264 RepID=A0A1F8ABR8_9EURO|nr:FAD dependent oxidoreductase [Aspergillus bombycis]OGM49142.1 FAD dependent oxidoreductase [Aspergillus bombycis]
MPHSTQASDHHVSKPSYRHQPYSQPQPSKKSKSRSKPKQLNTYNRCWDWIVTDGNCHYAKNRSTFRSYRRAPGKIAGSRVLGVGSVELRVRRRSGDGEINTLVLDNVLHMPNARCNGLSLPKYRETHPLAGVDGEGDHVEARSDDGSEPEWYAERYHGLSRVVLAGEPQGESHLSEDGHYMLSVMASTEEMEKLWQRVENRSWVA